MGVWIPYSVIFLKLYNLETDGEFCSQENTHVRVSHTTEWSISFDGTEGILKLTKLFLNEATLLVFIEDGDCFFRGRDSAGCDELFFELKNWGVGGGCSRISNFEWSGCLGKYRWRIFHIISPKILYELSLFLNEFSDLEICFFRVLNSLKMGPIQCYLVLKMLLWLHRALDFRAWRWVFKAILRSK